MDINSNKLYRILFKIFGSISLIFAILGIFLPLLPTTPLLLLSAFCYSKSSTKLHNWLLNNKLFGSYIKNYQEKRGIPLKIKVLSISFLILTIGYSCIFVIQNQVVRFFLILIVVGVSTHILLLKTLK